MEQIQKPKSQRRYEGTFKIYALLREDIHQGVVWLRAPGLTPRGVVKIKNTSNGKSVYCETMQIEQNFLRTYNEAHTRSLRDENTALVIGFWHREKLGGIRTKEDANLVITPANCILGRLKACFDHPQIVVRVATLLGVLGFAFGLVGLVVSVIPFLPSVSAVSRSASDSALKPPQLSELLLRAELKDGSVSGKVFNRLSDIVITQITVEVVPKDETNIFNANAPRFVEVTVNIPPRSMSGPFFAETGQLNPDFHSLRIAEAKGHER